MADESGSARDRVQKVFAWIAEKWKGPRQCPICAQERWSVQELMSRLPTVSQESGINLARGYPQILVICENCGYTLSFNAIVMQIEPADKKPDQQETGERPAKESARG